MKFKRNFVSLFLALSLLGTSIATVSAANIAEEVTYPIDLKIKPGDANKDYIVNVADVTCIQKHISQIENISDSQLKAADFDGNGLIDITDATEIQKMLANIDYQSIVKPDNSYQNVRYEYVKEAVFTNPIDTKLLERDFDYFDGRKLDVDGWYLIKSADEYYDLFGYYRPYFDDNFFEENALLMSTFYIPEGEDSILDGRTISAVSRDGSTLYVEATYYFPERSLAWFDPKDKNISLYYQVNKEDIEDVNEIKVMSKYVYDEFWFEKLYTRN